MNTDMDAAQGIKTDAVLIRKKYLCEIYGLTEDTAPAGNILTSDGPIHTHKERTSGHEG